MKRIILLMVVALMSVGLATAFSGSGSGTGGDPFEITTCAQLQEMKDSLGSNYTLVNDIDCDVAPFNTGLGFEPIGSIAAKFSGNLDGGNHTISNLYINRIASYVGLFGYTLGAKIKNVGLVNVDITSDNFTGSFVGKLDNGTIVNSYATGRINGSYTLGGLVGYADNHRRDIGLIKNSYADVNVTGFGLLGGLVALNHAFLINNSYATGNIKGNANLSDPCLKHGVCAVTAGLCCTGVVIPFSRACSRGDAGPCAVAEGGLVGFNSKLLDTDVVNSFSTGKVDSTGTHVGGLIGANEGPITNVFWDINRSGRSNCLGSGSGTCTGKNSGGSEPDYFFNVSNAPMTVWNFVNIWDNQCSPATAYPLLQGIAGQSCVGGAPDTDGDGFTDDVDNCPSVSNPDQSDLDSQDGGDVCDLCPDDATDSCSTAFSAGKNVNASGGTVNNSAGEVTIGIPPGALANDTSISLTKGGSNFQVTIPGRGGGTVLYEYTIGVPGTTFSTAVTLTFTYDPGAGTPAVFKDEGAGFFDLGFDCTTTAGVCTGTITSLSTFALIIPTDSDNDTVPDNFDNVSDLCNNTVLPEVLLRELRPKHFADIDGDGIFETIKGDDDDDDGPGTPVDSQFTLADTDGCSCLQILEFKPRDDDDDDDDEEDDDDDDDGVLGEQKFGCTKGTMKTFIKRKGWAKDITGSAVLETGASSWLGVISVLSIIALVIVSLSAFKLLRR